MMWRPGARQVDRLYLNEQKEMSERKLAALGINEGLEAKIKALKDEQKRKEKLCRRTYPEGHVYQWFQNESVSGGCWACVGCDKRQDGMPDTDKHGHTYEDIAKGDW